MSDDVRAVVERLLPLTPEYAALLQVPHLREFVVDLGTRMYEAGRSAGAFEADRDRCADGYVLTGGEGIVEPYLAKCPVCNGGTDARSPRNCGRTGAAGPCATCGGRQQVPVAPDDDAARAAYRRSRANGGPILFGGEEGAVAMARLRPEARPCPACAREDA